MKRSKLVIRLGLLAVAVGLVVFALLRPGAPEPVHLGRSLREWLVEFDYRYDTTNYSAAQEAIRAMGTNCLPFLNGYLRSKDPPFNRQWVRLKARLGLLRKSGEYAVLWHSRAAKACGELGQDGAPAFPAMMEAMNDPGATDDVPAALSRMLPKSAPVLTNVLATGNIEARSTAASALRRAYSHPEIEEMARTALINALRDPDPNVRMNAASAFTIWNKRLEVVVPALTRALSDPNGGVRANAAISLGNFGSAAKPAVPELIKLYQDTNDYPRKCATNALLKIDPEAAAKAAGK
ncbi:MAG TPA: HEAT repeat domain-containing protein [Verrucomicrobiae bacterium]|nr:HEAT repeat domain-containing protein [Verrucomicrobiae bacterium]